VGDSISGSNIFLIDSMTISPSDTAIWSRGRKIGLGLTAGGGGGAAGIAWTNGGSNRIGTYVDVSTINAESNLTFDGSTLGITGALTVSNITSGPAEDKVLFYNAATDGLNYVDGGGATGEYLKGNGTFGNPDHDLLTNYVANEHFNHANIDIVTAANSGLAGGSAINANVTLTLDADNLQTVTDPAVIDYIPWYDNDVAGTRKLSYSNLLLGIATDLLGQSVYVDTLFADYGAFDEGALFGLSTPTNARFDSLHITATDSTLYVTVGVTQYAIDLNATGGGGGGGVSLVGSTNNTITTVTGADAIQGEANLTFDGSTLDVTGGMTLLAGATVDNIETTLTDDDTHLPTSGAVVDGLALKVNIADSSGTGAGTYRTGYDASVADAAIALNTSKSTNVSTALSAGTVNATTYGITSDGGADDIVLPEADTDNAGLLGADKWDEIVANTSKTTNATHSGEVTGATTLTIANNVIEEANLEVTNSPTDNYLLSFDNATGGFTWVTNAGSGTFLGLTDITDASYSGKAGYIPMVESGEAAMALVDIDTTAANQIPLSGFYDDIDEISKSGTPVNNQVGIFVTDSTMEGDSDLTFDGSDLTTTGTVTWSGGGSANANTAYSHSQDNTQAHSDYLLNSGSDETSGTLTAAGFSGPLTGNVTGDVSGNAGTATVATTVTITDNESTAENNPLVFVENADPDGGNLGLETDGTTYYTPSTGIITATGFNGALTGNVTGDVSGTAGLATTVTVTDDESTADNQEIVFTTDNLNLESDGDLYYNPSSGTVTWSGGGSANANTAYSHSQDNTQAHSDYLLNSGSDATSGTLTATGFIIGSADVNETELEIIDGATLTTTELNFVDGVTSDIQTQFNAKAPIADPTFTGEIGIGAVNVSETELGILEGATVTTGELNFVDNVTSAIQTQLDGKADLITQENQTGTTYTFVLADAGKLVTLSNASAITLTIPTNASVAFPINTVITFTQLGAGLVTVDDASVTMNSYGGADALLGQYAVATLIKTGTDTWLLSGAIE